MDTTKEIVYALTVPLCLAVAIYLIRLLHEICLKRADFKLEKERNQHEIIMHYLKQKDETTLEQKIKGILDPKFSEIEKKIQEKTKEVEDKLKEFKQLVECIKKKDEEKEST